MRRNSYNKINIEYSPAGKFEETRCEKNSQCNL